MKFVEHIVFEDETTLIRKSVSSAVIDRREQVDGYDFIFPNTDLIKQNLHKFVDHESQCCSFFDFDIYEEEDHLICSVVVTRYDVETGKEIILALFE